MIELICDVCKKSFGWMFHIDDNYENLFCSECADNINTVNKLRAEALKARK